MRKIQLTAEQLEWLIRSAVHGPPRHAFDSSGASVADLAAGLRREFGLEVSDSTVNRLLRAEGLTRVGNRWRRAGA
jgi:transposase